MAVDGHVSLLEPRSGVPSADVRAELRPDRFDRGNAFVRTANGDGSPR